MVAFMKKRWVRAAILVLADLFLFSVSYYIAYLLRFDGHPEPVYMVKFGHTIAYTVLIKVLVYAVLGLYHSLWRYAGVEELMKLFFAAGVGTLTVLAVNIFSTEVSYLKDLDISVPRSIYLIAFFIDVFLTGGIRFAYRLVRRINRREVLKYRARKRTLVIGAGDAGASIIKEMHEGVKSRYNPVGIIDDDPNKMKRWIHGIPVLGTRQDISDVVLKKKIEEIIIAIPSLNQSDYQEILQACEETGVSVKTVPRLYDLIDGKLSISAIRPVQIEDLLGRPVVKLDGMGVREYLAGKKVLVTGAGGSIGSELCRQIAALGPSALHMLDIHENSLYDIGNELKRAYPGLELRSIIASVRDKQRIDRLFEAIRPDTVFHAAAHKHVPLMEDNQEEAIKNNVFGTWHVADASRRFGAGKFVLVSTDKAVNPTNVMGASKRLCEMIVQAMSKGSATGFSLVRFGNVLGSNGSVIPLFKKQIAAGGPVTVTDKRIIRYFMTIPEAVQLVMQAGGLAKGGEIFVLDMGEPVLIDKLARDLIRLSGFEPDKDIQVVYTGLRPGEKLYEELLMEEEGLSETPVEKIFIARPMAIEMEEIRGMLAALEAAIRSGDDINAVLAQAVGTYRYEEVD